VAEAPRGPGEPHEAPAYCAKLLYALSGLIKNNETIQNAAGAAGVFDWLIGVGIRHRSLPVSKKSLGILETTLAQNPEPGLLESFQTQRGDVAAALLARVRGAGTDEADLDTVEKALRLMSRLVSLRPFLFPPSFREELVLAGGAATGHCEREHGPDSELCGGIRDLASKVDLMLVASEVPDEEL